LSSSGRLKSHASSPKELKDDGYLSVGVARCLSCDPGDHVDDGSPSAVITRNPRANPGDHNDEGIARIRGSTPDNHKDEVQFRPESLEFHSSNLAITDSSRYDWRTAPTLYTWRTLRRHPAPTLAVSAVDIWVARGRTYGVPSTDRATACIRISPRRHRLWRLWRAWRAWQAWRAWRAWPSARSVRVRKAKRGAPREAERHGNHREIVHDGETCPRG
jgi:hypothetical protein